jgi:predicted dehydrogenase/nucleoside-diphosphate-sugar epimerase
MASQIVTTSQGRRHSAGADTQGGRVRVALIGCGAIAQQMHLPVLAGHEGVELAALVDRDLDRARKLAQGYGVSTVLSDARALPASRIHAAIVATPPFHHAPCAIELMRRGIHVLVEKPMATRYADAVTMVETAREHGMVLSVGFFRRLYPSFRLLKGLLDTRWLGQPRRFEVEGGGMYNWQAATLANMRQDWAGGGVLIDFGSHMLDLLLALFEEPAEVLEYRDNAWGGIEADCSIRLRLYHQGDAVEGTVELARTRNIGSLIRIACERGTLEFQVGERFRVRIIPHDLLLCDALRQEMRPYWLNACWENEVENVSWYETFRMQIDDWLEAIRIGGEPQLSGQSALPVARLIETCYQRRERMHEPWVLAGCCQKLSRDRLGPSGNGVSSTSLREPVAVPGTASRRRVLVTGATGFIGCRVAEILCLREGWDVRALVHNPGNASRLARLAVDMVQGDLRSEQDALRLVEGCDAVVHCAIGTAWGQRREIFAVTVDGTRKLAEAALHAGVQRFVHLSTISVYGDDSQMTGVIDESTPIRPVKGSDYGESKVAAEQALQQLVAKGLCAVILRPARVFGPFSSIFITRPVRAMAAGCFQWLGQPEVPCDMVYVDNLVEAIVRALTVPADRIKGETFAISDGDAMTWREFYGYFAQQLGLDLASVPTREPRLPTQKTTGSVFTWPGLWYQGLKTVVTSAELRAFGQCVLRTDPWGTLPRWALERFPGFERFVRKCVKADDTLPLYRREAPMVGSGNIVVMGSGGALVCIDKARRLLGYEPLVPRERALEFTLEWVRHARLVS